MSQDLPPELEFKNVYKMAPVIEDKELRQTLPVSSQIVQQGSAGSQSIVFRIPNDQGMSHDLSSMWLSFDFQVTGLGSAYTNDNVVAAFNTPTIAGAAVPFLSVSDSMESLFRDVRVYVNGSELEAITNSYNLLETALQPHMNNSNYANGPGAGSYFMNVSHMDKCRILLTGTRSDETRSHKINCAVPLRFLGISNTRQLLPTYRLGGGAVKHRD